MKAKKIIALFISTVLTIGTLAGCSSSGNGSSDGKSASSGSGKIELEFFTQKTHHVQYVSGHPVSHNPLSLYPRCCRQICYRPRLLPQNCQSRPCP